MTARSRALLVALAAAALLAACADDGGNDTGSAGPEDPATDEAPTTDGAEPDAAGGPLDGSGAADDEAPSEDATDAGDDAAGDDAETDEATDAGSIAVARSGTWPVGDAGTVTFEVEGDALVLVGYEPSDGWDARVDEEDDDEIEVDFQRDDVRWEFEVELDDGQLEIEIRQDHLDAEPGAYDLPDGGAFAFEADGDLTLASVTPGDGWEVTDQEEGSDEIEISLRATDRRLEVEVELDDGRIEIEIDYEVVGPMSGE